MLVTGGAGFIGSELVRQLAARGERVVVVDNLVNGKREHLVGLPSAQVMLVEADVRAIDAFRSCLREARIVYHLACLGVRHSVHSPVENHDVNATATLHLLAACRDAEVPRFVHVSSSEVYGPALWAPMAEEHPTSPCTVYGAAKLAGESYARAFSRTYRYPTVIVRPFNTYGPRSHHEGDSGEVIPRFLLRCLARRPMVVFGDGRQTRDFTFVEDTARGILLAGTVDAAVGVTLNHGSGTEVSINGLAAKVAAVAGCDPEVVYDTARPGDVSRLCSDVSRAKSMLGFAARVPLHDGLSRLLEWYRAQDRPAEELLRDEVVRNWDVKPVAAGPAA